MLPGGPKRVSSALVLPSAFFRDTCCSEPHLPRPMRLVVEVDGRQVEGTPFECVRACVLGGNWGGGRGEGHMGVIGVWVGGRQGAQKDGQGI